MLCNETNVIIAVKELFPDMVKYKKKKLIETFYKARY